MRRKTPSKARSKDQAQRLISCLRFVRGESAIDIAESLVCDRSTVTRWLNRAERDRWIERRPRLTLTPEQLLALSRDAHDTVKAARLLKLLSADGSPLRQVLVAYIIPPLDDEIKQNPEALAERLREVTGRAAACYINALIEADPAHVQLGVVWGRSLRQVVQHIAELPHREIHELTVFPMIGNLQVLGPWRREFVSAEANDLSATLTRIYSGSEAGSLPVPAFLPKPKRKSDRTLAILRRYFEAMPFYSEIFGSPSSPGRVWNNRITIIGIGAMDYGGGWPGLTRRLSERDLAQLEKAGAVGDLAGQFFDEKGLHPPACRCLLCTTNERVLAVSLRTLQGLARNEIPSDVPPEGQPRTRHVIAVASGRKARAIIAACRRLGAISDLVTDEDTASEMLSILDAEGAPAADTEPAAAMPARRRSTRSTKRSAKAKTAQS
jgi:DNA-binding transcriptional regulator LsrR (DeoR family)